MTAAAPLPDGFLDWWFAPWHATAQAPAHAAMAGALSLRDGYRLWCAQAGLAPGLPPCFEPRWAEASGTDPAALGAAARLYGGLLAARAQDAAALATLPPTERDWCLRLAATQPLPCYGRELYLDADTLELRGLCELACHLEAAFPGLWPRLRGGLDAASVARIAVLLGAMAQPLGAATAARARRCWLLCRVRAASLST
ncbi:hypothetical protein IV454_18765 [Massilia antarctica]|uniref:Type III secretion protein n=1 Tax=Massilia antarctica TaxID=2765360 RepID=A0AA48W932_9BURK|nr:hypothetical protein [Massilia antarctica]QPI47631.1 hypothetical protein IV454_18765 [Massilia antarctica]